MEEVTRDGIELAELIVKFTNRKDLVEHVNIFFETNEALLILNSAEALLARAKQKNLIEAKE